MSSPAVCLLSSPLVHHEPIWAALSLSLAKTLHPQPCARLRRGLFFLFRLLTRLGPTEDDSPQEEREEGYPVLPDGLRSIWHW